MKERTLATSTGRRKLEDLKAHGFAVTGLMVSNGDQHGAISDFGRVLWWVDNSHIANALNESLARERLLRGCLVSIKHGCKQYPGATPESLAAETLDFVVVTPNA